MAIPVPREIPPYITVCGINFFMTQDDIYLNARDIVTYSDREAQTLAVLSTIPFDRQCSYICKEIAWEMLHASGIPIAECNSIGDKVGAALYSLLSSNLLEWVGSLCDPLPDTVEIMNNTYTIRLDNDDHLNDKSLGGEIDYTALTISLATQCKAEAIRLILCHEITHGLLYECGYKKHNDERIVKPLGYMLYMLLRDNNFNFMYKGKGALL